MTLTTRKRIAAREFRAMAEAGIFDEDERLELVDGELIKMTPINPEHAYAVRQLITLLSAIPREHAVLDVQNLLLMPGDNEFYPDIMILRPRQDLYRSLPRGEDALLVAEVAKSSLMYDREVKRAKYGGAGVLEYWVVDLEGKGVWTYAEPSPEGYLREGRAAQDKTLEAMGQLIPVSRLF